MLMKLLFSATVIVGLWRTPAFAQQYHDPIAYCQAVKTIDKPDSRYTGPKLPSWMAKALNLEPSQSNMMEWRCSEGSVFACLYGANIPCGSKADTNRTPTRAISDYCKHNKNATFVPAVVTGHETAVSWACQGKQPVVTSVAATDSQGYVSSYWKKVEP